MSKELDIKILKKEPTNFDFIFKIIVIGDYFVGKSCLTIRAINGTFEQNYTPTIGFEFLTFYIRINDSNIKMQVWDTCGQETYRALIRSFYNSWALAILVYSIDNKNSFESLDLWLNEIKNYGNADINMVLIGNKVDLEDRREVKKEMGEDYYKKNGMNFFLETSAKTGINAENIFLEASKILYEQQIKIIQKYKLPKSIGYKLNDKNGNLINDILEGDEENEKKRKKCCL